MAVTNFQGALRTYILADSTVSGLIGQRLYAYPAPQGVSQPYAILHKIDFVTENNMASFDEVVKERWQIDIYSTHVDILHSVRNAIFDRLHLKAYESWSDYKVYLCSHVGENTFDEPIREGTQDVYHRVSMDYMIKRSYEPIT